MIIDDDDDDDDDDDELGHVNSWGQLFSGLDCGADGCSKGSVPVCR